MPDTATLTTWLEEAEAALHRLLTGTSEVQIDYDGRRVTYTAANAGDLRAHITNLKRQLGQTAGRRVSPEVLF